MQQEKFLLHPRNKSIPRAAKIYNRKSLQELQFIILISYILLYKYNP
jgi:hypothetical protein